MKRKFLIGLIAALVVYVVVRKMGKVTTGNGTVTAKKPGVRFVDPCPGADVIFDAATGKCIPLVEEPVPPGLIG